MNMIYLIFTLYTTPPPRSERLRWQTHQTGYPIPTIYGLTRDNALDEISIPGRGELSFRCIFVSHLC